MNNDATAADVKIRFCRKITDLSQQEETFSR